MAQMITGTATFSSQANRDAALTRVNAVISSYSLTAIPAVGFSAGVTTPTTTTMSVSFTDLALDGQIAAKAIYDAWVQSNRHTSGWLALSSI